MTTYRAWRPRVDRVIPLETTTLLLQVLLQLFENNCNCGMYSPFYK
jgi:hypothetical protein